MILVLEQQCSGSHNARTGWRSLGLGEIGTAGLPPLTGARAPRKILGAASVLAFVHRPCRSGKGTSPALGAYIDEHHMVARAHRDEWAPPDPGPGPGLGETRGTKAAPR